MNRKLLIDTTNSDKTIVGIRINRKTRFIEQNTNKLTKSQNLLILIEKLLTETGMSLKDLTAIEVKIRDGSFTGIRVGITVANTLAWVLQIPVNNESMVIPKYSSSKFDR